MIRHEKPKTTYFNLVACFILGIGFRIPVNAAYNGNDETEFTLESGETSIATLDLSQSSIARYVDSEVLASANHVRRLTDEEELNTYLYENADGTRTLYVMDENVKYLADDGTVHDKNLALQASVGGYSVTDNEFGLLLPTHPTDGVELTYAGSTVKLIPICQTSSTANADADADVRFNADVGMADNTVTYDDFFGNGIDLRYTPLLSGVKEDIILSSYTGVNSFHFALLTDGLNLYDVDGRIYLADSETAEERVYLGDVLVYDAVGKPDEGSMIVTTVQTGERYLLTVVVGTDYLTDSTTVYPVTVDPTLTVSDNTNGSGAIEDCPIYQDRPDKNHGTYIYNRVGYADDGYGVGRTAVRFNGLINSTTYQNLLGCQIVDAKFYVKESSGGSTVTAYMYPIYNTTWTESGLTWNNLGSYSSAGYVSDATLKGNSVCVFDVKSYLKSCKSGSYSLSGGLLIKSANEAVLKSFYSSECGTSSNRPYITVKYIERSYIPNGTYMLNSLNLSGMITSEDTSNDGVVSYMNSFAQSQSRWIITNIGDNFCTIRSQYSNLYLGVSSTSSGGSVKQYSSSSPSTNNNLIWGFYPTTSGNYQIVAKSCANKSLAISQNSSNSNLMNRSYTDDMEYTDEWELIGNKQLSLLALPYFVENLSFFVDIETCMENIGYDDFYDNLNTVDDGMEAGEILGRIAFSEICLVRTHGTRYGIYTSPDEYYLQRATINGLEDGFFTNTQLLILECCLTGSGGESANNLVNAFHNKGIPAVIGFEKSVNNIEANFWCQLFFESLSEGKTVRQACEEAQEELPEIWSEYCNDPINEGMSQYAGTISTYPYCLVGDETLVFN
ncbi:MAG: DNRLRE domain-containing protein [Eubacteriales bacterium]